jgi:hypothetical protein
MASWKRQKGHQQEVGCVPRQNSRKRLHEIGRESFCHGSSRLLAVRSKPQYPRMLQSATAISGQKPTADLLLTFPSDIRVDKVLQPTTSLQYVRALGRAWQRCWEPRAFTRDGAPTHERVDVHRPGNGTPKQAPGGIAPGWQTEHDDAGRISRLGGNCRSLEGESRRFQCVALRSFKSSASSECPKVRRAKEKKAKRVGA